MDSVRIHETDTVYVGEPNAIAVARDGSVFISDIRERKVVRVSRDGLGLTVVAGRGGGPGEVSSPTSLAVLGDSLLVIQNAGRKRLELFSLQPLRYRETVTMLRPMGNIGSDGNGVLASSLMPDSGTAFVALSNAYIAVRSGGTVPELYRQSPPVAQAFGATVVARDGDYVVGAFEVTNTVYRWPLNGSAVDSVVLSAAERRGARPDIIEELLRDQTKAADLAFKWSVPFSIAALSNDRSAIVFVDPIMSATGYTGQSFLQIVDWQRHASCKEFAMPVPTASIPRFAVHGDTVVAVVQHPDGPDAMAS